MLVNYEMMVSKVMHMVVGKVATLVSKMIIL